MAVHESVQDDVHVVVFRAIGDHFSAGADLTEFGTAPSVWAMRDARWGRDVWGLLRSVEVPMLALATTIGDRIHKELAALKPATAPSADQPRWPPIFV